MLFKCLGIIIIIIFICSDFLTSWFNSNKIAQAGVSLIRSFKRKNPEWRWIRVIITLSTWSRNLSPCSTRIQYSRPSFSLGVAWRQTQLDISFGTNLVGGKQIYWLISLERKLLDINCCTCLKNCSAFQQHWISALLLLPVGSCLRPNHSHADVVLPYYFI